MAEIDPIKAKEDQILQSSNKIDDERIDHILSNLLKLAAGDFKITELPEIQNDSLDAIDRGLVMLGEHLDAYKAKQEKYILEKENLIKEVHHRVKNNLQIISSLFNLQSQFTKSEDSKHLLKQSQYRIKSMSVIHEMLYKSENISQVLLKDYFETLTDLLITSIKEKPQQIEMEINVPSVLINLDSAVTLGLIVNEVITNSLIHGIKDKGKIYIEGYCDEDSCDVLRIGDDGVGFVPSENTTTLGTQLIEILAEQLNGEVERKIENGTHYSFKFKSLIVERAK